MRSFVLCRVRLTSIVVGLFAMAGSAWAQISIPSNGSSGTLEAAGQTYEIDLSLARTGRWDDTNVGPNGIYDPEKWAIVFHYTSVNIPAGTTVVFKNHPKNPPVVWLVQGNVTINGYLNLNGQGALGSGRLSIPGPGGFRGGTGNLSGGLTAGGGFGPGGGSQNGGEQFVGGSYGSKGTNRSGPTYNNAKVVPLIGGSGGSARNDSDEGGGAGGGAILIACSNTVSVGGTISASGGPRYDRAGGGSGGGLRVLCNQLTGPVSAFINAVGGDSTGGLGRIRLESNTFSFAGSVNPVASTGTPDPTPVIWPDDTAPILRVTSIGGVPVPDDPEASFTNTDVTINTNQEVEVILEAKNVPLDWIVQVRRVGKGSFDGFANATFVSGTQQQSTWKAMLTFGAGGHAVIARAYKP